VLSQDHLPIGAVLRLRTLRDEPTEQLEEPADAGAAAAAAVAPSAAADVGCVAEAAGAAVPALPAPALQCASPDGPGVVHTVVAHSEAAAGVAAAPVANGSAPYAAPSGGRHVRRR
jgi:hypothetical protein